MSSFKEKALIQKILIKCKVSPKKIYPPEKGYRNKSYRIKTKNNKYCNLIIYKQEVGILDKIKNANYVGNFLFKQGLPVRKPLSNKISRLQNQNNKNLQYACLYNYLPGETIPWEAYTQKHLKLLGKTLGNMHFPLSTLPQKNIPLFNDEMKKLNQQMRKYFENGGVTEALHKKLQIKLNPKKNYFQYFNFIFDKLNKTPKQPLHMDFVRSNILFKCQVPSAECRKPTTKNITLALGTRHLALSGILDFEKTLFGPAILDIARTLAFLVIDCKYKTPKKIQKNFLYSGYQKRSRAFLPDLTYLEGLLTFFWLYDFYKFLRHNPYEYLNQNEHFLRTRNILLSKSALQNTGNLLVNKLLL